jgi:hypothetical protein
MPIPSSKPDRRDVLIRNFNKPGRLEELYANDQDALRTTHS